MQSSAFLRHILRLLVLPSNSPHVLRHDFSKVQGGMNSLSVRDIIFSTEIITEFEYATSSRTTSTDGSQRTTTLGPLFSSFQFPSSTLETTSSTSHSETSERSAQTTTSSSDIISTAAVSNSLAEGLQGDTSTESFSSVTPPASSQPEAQITPTFSSVDTLLQSSTLGGFTSTISITSVTTSAPSGNTQHKNIGAIVGGILGGVIIMMIITLFYLIRRLRRRKQVPTESVTQETNSQANITTPHYIRVPQKPSLLRESTCQTFVEVGDEREPPTRRSVNSDLEYVSNRDSHLSHESKIDPPISGTPHDPTIAKAESWPSQTAVSPDDDGGMEQRDASDMLSDRVEDIDEPPPQYSSRA
ncbi:hypothetical protein K435DRAFT_785696 [Dendrothele bispora CBS 962.96]|uniref:Mid2 domain-containing protein n=1 Tax=Dendrothele bispora (strain CBS 962.96) TaxID=1314807 RepID=A0A4S8KV80_DENBC|nr:hypothetical protein K435DRAFT_785696 [Dendrothele bispora CBS 962.96]